MNIRNRLVNQWIEKADHDLGTAKITFLHIPNYYDTIAFHCQQAVEKYIKAILIYHQISFVRTHDLIYLLNLLNEQIVITDEILDMALTLNSFSVEIRYPEGIQFLSSEELELSISTADFFRTFAIENTEYIDL